MIDSEYGIAGQLYEDSTIQFIELTGFKCFQEHVVCGPLPGPGSLVAVVGPNGCGKSVVGEAISFALGGNRRMLRAGSLAALINQQRIMHGQNNATATITISGRCLTTQSQVTLVIERALNGSRSGTRIRRLVCGFQQQKFCTPLEETQPAMQWEAVTQEELHKMLLPYGLNTKAIDRYVVAQSRQAIEVEDPLRLVSHLEVMLGSSGIADQVRDEEAKIRSANGSINRLEDEHERLEGLREALAPEVTKWQAFQNLQAEVYSRRGSLLDRHKKLLCAHLMANRKQAAKLQTQLDHLDAVRSAAMETLEEDHERRDALARIQRCLEVKCKEALQQAGQTRASMAQAQDQVKKAQQAAESSARLQKLLAKRSSTIKSNAETAAAAKQEAAQRLTQAEALHQNLQEEVKCMKGQKGSTLSRAEDLKEQQEQQQQQCQLTADLSEQERQLRDTRSRHARLRREAQEASAQLASVSRGHLDKVAAMQEAEHEAASRSAAAQAAAAEVIPLDASIEQARRNLGSLQEELVNAQIQLQAAETTETLLDGELKSWPEGSLRNTSRASQGMARPSGGRWLAYDSLVAELYARERPQSNAQRLHQVEGRQDGVLPTAHFYGRLCNVLCVPDQSVLAAVNAVLAEFCNMATTLVVSDRATAYMAVAAFKSSRVGSVTCKVVSELRQRGCHQGQQGLQQAMLPGGVAGRPLAAFVTAAGSGIPDDCTGMVQSLLGGWSLVKDRSDAMMVLAAQRQQQPAPHKRGRLWSLVTPLGEIFKSDGEIVAKLGRVESGRQQPEGSYGLGSSVKPVLPEAAVVSGPANHYAAALGDATKERARLAAKQKEAGRQMAEIRSKVERHRQEASAAESELLHLVRRHRQLHLTAAEESRRAVAANKKAVALVKSMTNAGYPGLAAAGKAGRPASGQGLAGEKESAETVSYVDALRMKEDQLRRAAADMQLQLEACAASCLEKRQILQSSLSASAGNANDETKRLAAAQKRLREAASIVSKMQMELEACQGTVCRLQAQADVHAVQMELQEQQQQQSICVADLKAKLGRLVVQAEKIDEKAEKHEEELSKLANQAVHLEASMAAGQARLDALALDLATAKASQTRALEHSQQLEDQLASVASELLKHSKDSSGKCLEVDAWDGHDAEAQDQEPPELSDTAGEAKQGNAGSIRDPAAACRKVSRERKASGGMKRQLRSSASRVQQQVEAATSGNAHAIGSDSGSSSSGSDFEDRRQGGCGKEGIRSSDQHLLAPKDVAAEEAWVARESTGISKKQVQLDALRQAINTNALKEDIEAMRALDQARAELRLQEAHVATTAAARDILVEQRFSLLSEALAKINFELSQVYQFLTAWVGDAYLQYTNDQRLLFTTGVTLHVRPDQHKWRPFASLSGGQQALATLALAFAMQAAFPSPFYFFDEVDAALDTLNAERVAEYMLLRSRGARPVRPGMHDEGQGQPPGQGKAPKGLDAATEGEKDYLEMKCCGNPVLSKTQYIVVSHKPQVFERAHCLIGLYSHKSACLSATAYFT